MREVQKAGNGARKMSKGKSLHDVHCPFYWGGLYEAEKVTASLFGCCLTVAETAVIQNLAHFFRPCLEGVTFGDQATCFDRIVDGQ